MARKRYLRKRQLEVLDDLFSGELDEGAVLRKHKVSSAVYNRWLAEELFVSEFSRRLASARFQSELIIARYSAVAAAKLVALTESDKPETARKACLDIINSTLDSRCSMGTKDEERGMRDEPQAQQVSPATASRLLAALAEEKNDG